MDNLHVVIHEECHDISPEGASGANRLQHIAVMVLARIDRCLSAVEIRATEIAFVAIVVFPLVRIHAATDTRRVLSARRGDFATVYGKRAARAIAGAYACSTFRACGVDLATVDGKAAVVRVDVVAVFDIATDAGMVLLGSCRRKRSGTFALLPDDQVRALWQADALDRIEVASIAEDEVHRAVDLNPAVDAHIAIHGIPAIRPGCSDRGYRDALLRAHVLACGVYVCSICALAIPPG